MVFKRKSRYAKKNGKFVHREVVKKRGEYLKPGFHHVHHKDGNPRNNRSSNLERMYNSEHVLNHDIKRKEKKFKKY